MCGLLPRQVYFQPYPSKDATTDLASSLFGEIFRHHGLPDLIFSDRDTPFTTKFWQHFIRLCSICLCMSDSHHFQMDGLSVVKNRVIDNYLKCHFTHHRRDLDKILDPEELAFSSVLLKVAGQSRIGMKLG